MDFYVLQVSLLPIEGALFYQSGKEKDIKYFEECLKFSCEKAEQEPWILKELLSEEQAGIKAGLISRPLPANLYDKGFHLHKEKSFPPVLWIWDKHEQALLVERRIRIFPNGEAAARVFSSIANPCLAANSLLVHIHPKLEEKAFWEVYKAMHTVEAINLELTSPNIFGETKQEVRNFLNTVAQDTNATTFKPSFENKEGKLMVRESRWLKGLLDWIKDGGGAWSIKGRPAPNRRIAKRSSSKSARILHYPGGPVQIELENYSSTDIKNIIESLRPEYTFRRQDENSD